MKINEPKNIPHVNEHFRMGQAVKGVYVLLLGKYIFLGFVVAITELNCFPTVVLMSKIVTIRAEDEGWIPKFFPNCCYCSHSSKQPFENRDVIY